MNSVICNLKRKKGFTLVELIVVIAIIAILTAVIVPMIARYSAQAQYTTLQDAARVISDSANNALADGNQVSAISVTLIEGERKNGELEVTFWYNVSQKASATISNDGVAKVATGGSAGENRAAERLCDTLATTIPDNCAFLISVANSAVLGVIFTNASSDVSSITGITIGAVDGFADAYADNNGEGTALGVSGSYLPSSST